MTWLEQREKKSFLALEDGSIFRGYSVGASVDAVGEVVFNTGMTGYQEILSDPSYSGQFVVMTCPEIGNTGANAEDMESARCHAEGLIARRINGPSNWRSRESLPDFLARNGKPALAGVDTRALTLKIRQRGSMKGFLSVTGKVSEEEARNKAVEWEGLDGQDYAARVSTNAVYEWEPVGDKGKSAAVRLKIVAYDYGIKWSILRSLKSCGFDVSIAPAGMEASRVLAMRPDGVLLSNGPADPAALRYAVRAAGELLGRTPLMGICLGHQILALASGAATYRMKFGHHGSNHPVMELKTGKVEITSQNHNFAVDRQSIASSKMEITHINLNDETVEGMVHKSEPAFSLQYHPEAGPGPRDSLGVFRLFRELIVKA
jgi:carbamoyl-phosphate synthase small subunit